MSGTGWEWADSASRSPHLQRTAGSVLTPAQEAYRVYVAHGANCPPCSDKTPCEQGDALWQAYQQARGDGAQRAL